MTDTLWGIGEFTEVLKNKLNNIHYDTTTETIPPETTS